MEKNGGVSGWVSCLVCEIWWIGVVVVVDCRKKEKKLESFGNKNGEISFVWERRWGKEIKKEKKYV